MKRRSFFLPAALALGLSAAGSGCGTVSIDGFREDATADAEPVDAGRESVLPDAGVAPDEGASIVPQSDVGPNPDVATPRDGGVGPDGFVSRDGGPPVDLGNDVEMTGPGDAPAMGPCAANSDCPARYYCEAAACGTSGLCRARPDTCTTVYDPVCGCDGRTYSNPCDAAGNGARINRRGECADRPLEDAGAEDAPSLGGCRSNDDCARSHYCAGAGCATAGVCQSRPLGCATVYAPVCGCDGQTYSNECAAQAAGQRFTARGACR